MKSAKAFQLALLHPRYWLTWFGLALLFLLVQLPYPLLNRLGVWMGRTSMRFLKRGVCEISYFPASPRFRPALAPCLFHKAPLTARGRRASVAENISMNKHPKLTEADVTPESVFHQRRKVLQALGITAATLALPTGAQADLLSWFKGNDRPKAPPGKALEFSKPAAWQAQLAMTPEDKVTGYNNFYEFGLDKADPAANAGGLKTEGWKVRIDGEVAKPITLDIDDLMKRFPLEQRIYRMRCVEAWSMVVPWIGFELGKLLKLAEPNSNARYVAFQTLYDPEQMPGQKDRFIGGGLKYPYVEGLRLDEAMHPLALLTVGVYGKTLPPQNGAPLRLITPWKYGFKGIKSIVHIRLVRDQPPTTWNQSAPNEYGFYANVNPHVDHPRWSQATERFIGSGGILDVKRQPTLLFNGYADQVASLYRGMDLRENF